MLFLIATPIGNLADLSFRAVETLKSCAYILCEDTRRSRILLNAYAIEKPLKSYHQFNEARREEEVISDLKEEKIIGLISDAGTPGIADPGERLVKRCLEEGIAVNAIPGACALIAGLVSSGLSTERFQFVGFLPRTQGRLTTTLKEILTYPGTTVCYETPHRLVKTLKILEALAPHRRVVIAKELTKKFERLFRGTPTELLELWKNASQKGEIVLLLAEEDDI